MVSCPAWHTLELVTFSGSCQALQQGCAMGRGGTDGAECPAQPLVLLPEPNLPATLPEHPLKEICHDCQNRGVAIPFPTGCVEFSQGILACKLR